MSDNVPCRTLVPQLNERPSYDIYTQTEGQKQKYDTKGKRKDEQCKLTCPHAYTTKTHIFVRMHTLRSLVILS